MAKTFSRFVARPLEGLALEATLVAMREILPAATATTSLADGGEVQFVTILPEQARSWRRADAVPVVALQPAWSSDDVSQDLGNALAAALLAEPGEPGEPALLGAPGPRLQDLLDPDAAWDFQLADSLAFWSALDPESDEFSAAVEASADQITPTKAVGETPNAYWTQLGEREFLRWSLGIEEDPLLDALARLQAKRQAGVMDGAKYAGAFRALGLVIPVWELPRGTTAEDLVSPIGDFRTRLDTALAETTPLDATERRSRAGLVARSLTLR
jgi:hypothetical protein